MTNPRVTRYAIARWHFAAAEHYLGCLDATDMRASADAVSAGSALVQAHLHAAEFAKSWDTYTGGDIREGWPPT